MTAGRRVRLTLAAIALAAVACAPSPRARRETNEEQKIWPAGPPPTSPGTAGDVPSVPPVVKP